MGCDHLDANFRRRGSSGSLGQVTRSAAACRRRSRSAALLYLCAVRRWPGKGVAPDLAVEDHSEGSARRDASLTVVTGGSHRTDGMETHVSHSSRAGVSRGCALPRCA
jgi:hypothetical protein